MAITAPLVHWPQGSQATVEIFWRWLHIIAALVWIGFLYFFNLVSSNFSAALSPDLRPRVLPRLMWSALNWFRWASVVTVLSGLALLGTIVTRDARNGGGSQGIYWASFFGIWIAVWVGFFLSLRTHSPVVIYAGSAVAIAIGAWLFLRINSHGWESNRALSIGIGGGMGLMLLLNVWGIVWRANKQLLRWMESGSSSQPMPAALSAFVKSAAITSRLSFYLSFVIVFFMASASHFPLFGT